jgi:hypothetical protein
MALHKGFGSYPLRVLAPIGAGAGLLALALAVRAKRGGRAPALSMKEGDLSTRSA